MTAAIKAKMRRNNRLMHAGRTEEADALAVRIGKDIASRCKTRLTHIDSKINAKDMWAEYRQLTGRKQKVNVVDGITAESLNQHYAAISTESTYQPPTRKQTAEANVTEVVSESASSTAFVRLPQVWISYRPGSYDSVPHCFKSHWHICSIYLYPPDLYHVNGKQHSLACQRYHLLSASRISARYPSHQY